MCKPTDYDPKICENQIERIIKNNTKCLVVEGVSDQKFFKKFTRDYPNIVIYQFNSSNIKHDILDMISSNREFQNNSNLLVFLDNDYENNNTNFNNIVYTEFNDIDNYFFSTTALECFITEYCDEKNVIDFFNVSSMTDIESIRSELYQRLKSLSLMRIVSRKNDFQIPFGKMFNKSNDKEKRKRNKKIRKALHHNNNYVCCHKLFILMKNHEYPDIDDKTIQNKMLELSDTNFNLCTNGHDLISLLTLLANHKKQNSFNDIQVESFLRGWIRKGDLVQYKSMSSVFNWIAS